MGDALELRPPQLDEGHILGRRPLDHGLAHQDPTGAGMGGDPGGQVDGAAEVVAALDHHRPGRHPDMGRRQAGLRKPRYQLEGRQHRPGGLAEVDHDPVASHFTGTPPWAREDRSTSTARRSASAAAAWSPCSSVRRV